LDRDGPLVLAEGTGGRTIGSSDLKIV